MIFKLPKNKCCMDTMFQNENTYVKVKAKNYAFYREFFCLGEIKL